MKKTYLLQILIGLLLFSSFSFAHMVRLSVNFSYWDQALRSLVFLQNGNYLGNISKNQVIINSPKYLTNENINIANGYPISYFGGDKQGHCSMKEINYKNFRNIKRVLLMFEENTETRDENAIPMHYNMFKCTFYYTFDDDDSRDIVYYTFDKNAPIITVHPRAPKTEN